MRVSGSLDPRERTTTGWLGSEDTIYQHLSLELAFSERELVALQVNILRSGKRQLEKKMEQ